RPLWTGVGIILGGYWLMPDDLHTQLFGEFTSDLEMFVISGIMIVISFTLIIVFNTRLLTGLFASSQGRAAYRVAGALTLATVAAAATGYLLRDTGDGLGELFYLLAGLIVPCALLSAAAARFPQI